MTVYDFLKSLGGSTKVARAIKLPLTTVHGWGRANSIPAWRVDAVVAFALSEGIPMPAEFTASQGQAA